MKHDQEDEYYEKEIDELAGIPSGFHIVDEEKESEDLILGEKEDIEAEELILDDSVDDTDEFKGKEFDFEHADEEDS